MYTASPCARGLWLEALRDKAEVFLKPGKPPPKPAEPEKKKAPAAAPGTGYPAKDSGPKPAAQREDGKVRCKNFGCNRYFTRGEQVPCQYHKSPPIFHETAKWWSCCPNNKAYDFDQFMAIPGCVEGFCSDQGQEGKRFLGGCDLREDSAPQRIDLGPDAPLDPRKKLDALRKGLVVCGVPEEFFDKYWGRQAAKHGDLETVCTETGSAINRELERVVNNPEQLSS